MWYAAGALVKLGEYDGLVLSYTPATGVYALRILQVAPGPLGGGYPVMLKPFPSQKSRG
jgi:hypothetical protein